MERQPTTRPSPVAVRCAVLGALLVALATGFAWAHAAQSHSSPPIITVSTDVPVFTPRIALVQPDQDVAFRNSTAQDMLVTATAHSPAPFQLRVVAGGTGHLRLHAPGLYHFYDAVTAQV